MKNHFFTLLLITLSIPALQAQTVPEVQQTLITKVTATWCINCGTWGWTFYENLSEDNDDKALLIKAHYSGDLMNTAGQEMGDNFNAFGQPRFILNNTDLNANSSNMNNLRSSAQATVSENHTQSPIANAGVYAVQNGNQLNFTVRTEFFQATSGNYYTDVYLVEDNVIASQSGQGSNTSHQDILRSTGSGSTFGNLVASGNINAGMDATQTFTVDINSDWNVDNMEFMAIVWSEDNGTYTFVNGSSTTLANSTAVEDIADDIQLSVYPTLTSTLTNISLDLQKSEFMSISLYNLQGQEVRKIQAGNLATGQHNFVVEKENLSSGTYILSIQNDRGVATEKIVFQ